MTRLILVRHGRAAGGWDDDLDPGLDDLGRAQAEAMAAWGAWFGSLGDVVIDGGNPTGQSKTITADGSVTNGGSGTGAPSAKMFPTR